MDSNTALFNVTFKLRKKTIVFQSLLREVEFLQENGFHLLFSTDNNGRWLQIDCYENTQQHPSLTIRRMLSSIPSKEEKMRISALNFAAMHNVKFLFSISETETEFTVTAKKPIREFDQKLIINNCKLLGVEIIK